MSKQRFNSNKKVIKMICGLSVLAICFLVTVVVYAKYYASRNNKGIVVASNIYFNSDKLKKTKGITDLDSIVSNNEILNQISVFTNSGSWSNVDLLLSFNITNYDNNILYNETNLFIDYKVEFILLDNPIGASYSAVSEDGTEKALANKGDKVEFSARLSGGTLEADAYAVKVSMESIDNYEPARVLILAYPTSPDYIYKDKMENQEFRLLGICEAHITETNMSIKSAGFVLEDNTKYTDTGWKGVVQDYSGFIYNIKTVGDIILESENSTKKEIKVTWNTDYLSIDKFDQYYLDATANNKVTINGNKTSMIIAVLPYTSIDITFYKTSEFDTELKAKNPDATGRQWFEGLVITEMNE